MSDSFISVRAAAAQLGLSETTIRRRLAYGILDGRRNPRTGQWQVRARGVTYMLELRAALLRSAALPGAVGPRAEYLTPRKADLAK